MRWRGDGDRHAVVPEGLEQIAACLAGQFPVVVVEMGDVVTRAGNGNPDRGSHEPSILGEYGKPFENSSPHAIYPRPARAHVRGGQAGPALDALFAA